MLLCSSPYAPPFIWGLSTALLPLCPSLYLHSDDCFASALAMLRFTAQQLGLLDTALLSACLVIQSAGVYFRDYMFPEHSVVVNHFNCAKALLWFA